MTAEPAIPATRPDFAAYEPDEGADLIAGAHDGARRLWRSRTTLLWTGLGGAALAAGLAFVLPPTFVATTQIVDSSPSSTPPAMERLGARLSELGIGAGSPSSVVTTYPDMLRSHRLLTALLARPVHPALQPQGIALIDVLVRRHGPADQRTEHGVRKLRRLMDVALDRRSGVLTLRASARDPHVAAEIANGAVALLQEIMISTRAEQASELRHFIERRLTETQPDLARAEDALRAFHESNLRIGNSPRLEVEEARFQRGVRVQEEVYLTLVHQYEVARIDEQRDIPMIGVLDPASPPAFRSSPRRVLLTAVGLVLGLMLGAAWTLTGRPAREDGS